MPPVQSFETFMFMSYLVCLSVSVTGRGLKNVIIGSFGDALTGGIKVNHTITVTPTQRPNGRPQR